MIFDPNFSAVSQVSMRFDGRVPPGLLDAAREIDRSSVRTVARVRVGAIKMKPETLISMMAEVIADAASRRGVVTEDDFARLGIAAEQIAAHKSAAFRIAQAEHPWLAEIGQHT